jgi:hypothetical protein
VKEGKFVGSFDSTGGASDPSASVRARERKKKILIYWSLVSRRAVC